MSDQNTNASCNEEISLFKECEEFRRELIATFSKSLLETIESNHLNESAENNLKLNPGKLTIVNNLLEAAFNLMANQYYARMLEYLEKAKKSSIPATSEIATQTEGINQGNAQLEHLPSSAVLLVDADIQSQGFFCYLSKRAQKDEERANVAESSNSPVESSVEGSAVKISALHADEHSRKNKNEIVQLIKEFSVSEDSMESSVAEEKTDSDGLASMTENNSYLLAKGATSSADDQQLPSKEESYQLDDAPKQKDCVDQSATQSLPINSINNNYSWFNRRKGGTTECLGSDSNPACQKTGTANGKRKCREKELNLSLAIEPTPQRVRKRKSKAEFETECAYFRKIGNGFYECELCVGATAFPRIKFGSHLRTKCHKESLEANNASTIQVIEKEERDASHLPTSSHKPLVQSTLKLPNLLNNIPRSSSSGDEVKLPELSADELSRKRKNELEQFIKEFPVSEDSMESSAVEEKIAEEKEDLSPLSTPSPPNVILPESPTPPKSLDEAQEPRAIVSPTVFSSKNDQQLELPEIAEVQMAPKPERNSEEDISSRLKAMRKCVQASKRKPPILESSDEEDDEDKPRELKWYERPDYVPNDRRGLQDPEALAEVNRIIGWFNKEKLNRLTPDDVAERIEAVAKINIARGLPPEQPELMWQDYDFNRYPEFYSRVQRPDYEDAPPDENGLVNGALVPWRFPEPPKKDPEYLVQWNYIMNGIRGWADDYRVPADVDWEELNPDRDLTIQQDGDNVHHFGNISGNVNDEDFDESVDQFGPEDYKRLMEIQNRGCSAENDEEKLSFNGSPDADSGELPSITGNNSNLLAKAATSSNDNQQLPSKEESYQLDEDQLGDAPIQKDLTFDFHAEHLTHPSLNDDNIIASISNKKKALKRKPKHFQPSSSVDQLSLKKSAINYWWFNRLEDGTTECLACKKTISLKSSKYRHHNSVSHMKAMEQYSEFDINLPDEEKLEMLPNDAVSSATETVHEYASNSGMSGAEDFTEEISSTKPEVVHSDNDPACQKIGTGNGKWKCRVCDNELSAGEYSWRRHAKGPSHKINLSRVPLNENIESEPEHQEDEEEEEYEDEDVEYDEDEEEFYDQDQEVEGYQSQSFKQPRLSDGSGSNVLYSHASANMMASSSSTSATAYQQDGLYNAGTQPAQMFTQPMMHPPATSTYSSNNYQYNSAHLMMPQQSAPHQYQQPPAIAATHSSIQYQQQQQHIATIPAVTVAEQKTIIQQTTSYFVTSSSSSTYPHYATPYQTTPPVMQQQHLHPQAQSAGMSSMMPNNGSNNQQVPNYPYYPPHYVSNGNQQPEQQGQGVLF